MDQPIGTLPTETTAPDVRDQETSQTEEDMVKKLLAEWQTARAFDKPQYVQMASDRRYASGLQGAEWAVSANLLGSYIDILVSYIYARNPKASIRPAEQTGMAAQKERQFFAKTLQIVVQRLWTDGKLKKAMRRCVRSGFSVSVGWIKAVMLVDTWRDPLIDHQLNDLRDQLEKIRVAEDRVVDPDATEPVEQRMAELELLIQGLEANVEVILRKSLAIDPLAPEQVQMALDVRDVDDYLEAGFMGDAMFILKDEALEKFPRLTREDLKFAKCYWQKAPSQYGRLDGLSSDALTPPVGEIDPRGEARQYLPASESNRGYAVNDADGKPVEYVCSIEIWDHRDLHIKTIVEGVKKWAREPFPPQFATSRFYPYFKVDFFPVDGERWPQSLTYRLAKLQDEYGGTRSSQRLTRQRAIPGTLFNSAVIDDGEMERVQKAVHDEFIGIKLRDAEMDLNKVFAPKPLPQVDLALFDTSPIIGDMEKISGVQEALQSSQTVQKTATQAEIEQSGFAARTTAERDQVEDMLSDFARYTAELALQALTYEDVVKIAGPLAFWPEGLSIEDVTGLLDVDIEAGSTGRPNTAADREAWGVVYPLIKDLITLAYSQPPGSPITKAYVELLKETLVRFDDRIDIERFLPGLEAAVDELMPADPVLGAFAAQGMGPQAMPPADAGGPPMGADAPPGAAPAELLPPSGQAPTLQPTA